MAQFGITGSAITDDGGGVFRYCKLDQIGSRLGFPQREQVRSTEGKVDFSTPKELMKIPSDFGVLSVLPDGKRMLATRRVGQHASVSLDLVLNWQHLLQ